MERGEGTQPLEVKAESWKYHQLFDYLLHVAKGGKSEILTVDDFPKIIELNSAWHNVLNSTREATKDGFERWTPIGFQQATDSIMLPTHFSVGTKTDTSGFDKEDEAKRYMALGITQIIGGVHSHPDKSYHNPLEIFLTSGRLLSEYRGFSIKDLKRDVELGTDSHAFAISGLVDGDSNFFSFITKETEITSSDPFLQEDKKFRYYWFMKYAPSILEKFPPKRSTLWEINLRIAERYNLVLYRGKQGGDLIRQYPN